MPGLREMAEADLATTLEDTSLFGWPCRLTDPAGKSADLTGSPGDISLLIDADTGLPISGRQVHFDLRMSSIKAAGFTGMPVKVPEESKKPWIMEFDSVIGEPLRTAVVDSKPDRTLGIIKLILERFEP